MASRFRQLSSSFLILNKTINILSPLSSSSPFSLLIKPFCSSPSSEVAAPHPWPEWDRFVEKLRTKGYLAKSRKIANPSSTDVNCVDNVCLACLAFARERSDIIRYLPQEDIETIVSCGCPNVYKKNVSSAKRLRVFLEIDEIDVCSGCKLQGSCDKAYMVEKEDNKAQTLDIMRILMNYALDPHLLSRASNDSIPEQAKASARKLLQELIDLNDTTSQILQDSKVDPPAMKKKLPKKHKVIRGHK